MLSKFFECSSDNFTKADTQYVSALLREVAKTERVQDVSVLYPGGTLGLFFKGESNGKPVFLKTHHPNEASYSNLTKEFDIMRLLYKDLLNIDAFSVCVNGNINRIMVMDYLNIQTETHSPQYISLLIEDYSKQISGYTSELCYSLDDFIDAVTYSKDCLLRENIIDCETGNKLDKALSNFMGYSEYSRTICHGDLSDVNIIEVNHHPIALDWEDALMNVKEYDLLYWLTFFSQRRLYCSSLFKDIGINETYGKDIMLMVIAVKSFLSVVKGTYKNNKLSIQDRMNEIIRM